jgi:lysozyme
MSDLIEQLRKHEGVEAFSYVCPAGYETIGVGRNISKSGLGLSADEIDYLLQNDINRCVRELAYALDWFASLDGVRQDALVNLCFNLGLTRLMQFKLALSAMERGEYHKAAAEFLDSRWAKQVGNRAIEVTHMIRMGEYP